MKKEMTIQEYDSILSEFLKAGVLYAKGGQLELLTKSVLDKKRAQYPSWYNGKSKVKPSLTRYEYLLSYCDKGMYIGDCCGVIKGIRMGNRVGKPHVYVASMDETIASMRKGLENVITKNVFSAPHGYLMVASDDGHVATVATAGETDFESAESCNGLKEVSLKYQSSSPNSYWKTCGKLPWMDYQEAEYREKVGDTIPMTIISIAGDVAYGSAKLKPIQKDNKISLGSKVTINPGAVYGGLSSTRGAKVPSSYANGSWIGTVSGIEVHNGEEEAIIRELVSWVATKYLVLV